jgi:DNA primase
MAEWIDFKAIKSMVTMAMLLEHYGVRLRAAGAGQLRGQCPLPQHSSKESKESFNVNTGRDIWSCKSQSCIVARKGKEGGNVLDFVMAMEDCRITDAAQKVVEWFGQEESSPSKADSVHEDSARANPTTPPGIVNKPLGFELKGIVYHSYLAERGITEETAKKFGVGFFPGKGSMAGRVVIPIRDEHGVLVAYAGRSIDNAEPKYLLPPKFQKHLVLFNRHAATGSTVILVEGFFGTMYLSQAGLPAAALMGCTISDEQEHQLPPYVVLLMDGDDAGRKATAEITARIIQNHFVRVGYLSEGKQPDSLSTEELRKLLAPLL